MAQIALTTGQVAKYCGVNFRTVIRWIERGELKSYKLPGRGDNRVQVPDFLEFLRQHEMPVPTELIQHSTRVLIVGSAPACAAEVAKRIGRAGIDADVVCDAFRAGAAIAEATPMVMIGDARRPDLNVIDMLEFLRSHRRYANMKVVVIGDAADVEQFRQAGADDIVLTPLDDDKLNKVADIVNTLAEQAAH